ncbi:hypothetical protein ACA910_014269 [Epithemia clementina (nom. ined.)]
MVSVVESRGEKKRQRAHSFMGFDNMINRKFSGTKPTAARQQRAQSLYGNSNSASKTSNSSSSKNWHVKMPRRMVLGVVTVFVLVPLVIFMWKETHLHPKEHHDRPKQMAHVHHHHQPFVTWMEDGNKDAKTENVLDNRPAENDESSIQNKETTTATTNVTKVSNEDTTARGDENQMKTDSQVATDSKDRFETNNTNTYSQQSEPVEENQSSLSDANLVAVGDGDVSKEAPVRLDNPIEEVKELNHNSVEKNEEVEEEVDTEKDDKAEVSEEGEEAAANEGVTQELNEADIAERTHRRRKLHSRRQLRHETRVLNHSLNVPKAQI